MEELGIGRPSTYASILAVLREREYVRLEKKRLVAEDKGLLVIAFLESFFKQLVEYDFTADLEEQLDRISNSEIDWKQVLRNFWRDFSAAVGETKELRTTEILDALNDLLAPHIFPPSADGADPRACPNCGNGQLSLKLGKFGAFIGCSNYPECRYTRQLMASGGGEAESFGDEGTPGVRLLGEDPETGLAVTLRDGRFGTFLQLGEAVEKGDKPKRSSLPPGVAPAAIDLERALQAPCPAAPGRDAPGIRRSRSSSASAATALTSSTARPTPTSRRTTTCWRSAPTGRSTSSWRRKAAPPSAAAASATPAARSARSPATGKTVVVKAGRFGPYVTDGEVNATLPRALSADAVTLDEAIALIDARRAAGPAKKPRRGTRGGAKASAPSAKAGAKKRTARKAGTKKAARKSASA